MDIVLRATFMFAVIFVLLRLLGKREMAEMTPFEVVLLVVMGDLIQQGVTHSDYSVTGATLAVATFAFWSLVLNWVTFTWPRAERLLDGEPQVVVRGGELLGKMMQRGRERDAPRRHLPPRRRRLGNPRNRRQDQLHRQGRPRQRGAGRQRGGPPARVSAR